MIRKPLLVFTAFLAFAPQAFTQSGQQLSIASLSPNNVTAGAPATTMTISGQFLSGINATVFWNSSVTQQNSTLNVLSQSNNQVVVTIPASLLAVADQALVYVVQGSSVSNQLTFTVIKPIPTLLSLSPPSAAVGSPAFTLTVNGVNFPTTQQGGLHVLWNGTPLVTTFVSTQQLTAQVPANLLTTAGQVPVTIDTSNNPQPLSFLVYTPLSLTSLTPNTAAVGTPGLSMTVKGGGFDTFTQVTWNGTAIATTYVDPQTVLAQVPSSFFTNLGVAQVNVTDPNETSPAPLPFTIATPLTLTSISPTTAVAGSGQFTLTLNGTGFLTQTSAFWGATKLTTTLLSGNQMTAVVPATLLTQGGTVSVTAQTVMALTPAASIVSNALPFTITTSPGITLTAISPNRVAAGGPAFTLTAFGSGYVNGAAVTFNGVALTTTFISPTQLTAQVPASLIAVAGTPQISVSQANQTTPPSLPLTVATLTLTSLSPSSAVAGGPGFNLTVNGNGFNFGTVIYWNGTPLETIPVSGVQVTATVPAGLIALAGSASVTAQLNSIVSNALPFTITAAPLTLSSLSPSSAVAGGPGFTLTVNGSGFNSGTVIYWNSTPLATTPVNGAQVTATVPAGLIAQAGSASVTAQLNSTVSNALPFTITAVPLTLTSISPNTAVAGGPSFTLTVNGAGFSTATLVTWNGTPLPPGFVSTTQLAVPVPANLIASVGTVSVGVSATGQTSPTPLPFTITSGLTLTSLTPSSVLAGGPGLSLGVTGTGFTTNSVVLFNGTALPTTFSNATSLTATVPPNLVASAGSAAVTVQNGSLSSNALTFTITSPSAILTSVTPNTAPAGSGQTTITVIGSGFLPPSGTAVTFNGITLTTTVVSRTQLTATIPANLLAGPGVASVGINATSQPSSLPFTITSGLTLTSISPSSVGMGGPAFTLTANGTGFTNSTLVTFNGTALITTFVSATQLTAQVPATLIATSGTAAVGVSAAGQVTPPTLPLTVTSALTLTSLSPATAVAGGPAFTLTATGTSFTPGTTLSFNSTSLTTTVVSPTQLSASVPASLIAQVATASVTASNGSLVSNALTFKITPPTPLITLLSPSTAIAGGAALSMTITGSGFLSSSTVTWNGTTLSATFGSATQLTAAVTKDLLAATGTASVVVHNGDLASNAATFTITLPPPVITSISPATVAAGSAAFTLSLTGTGFVSGATVLLGTTNLTTTFVSATQVTAAVPATAIAQAGTAQVSLTNPSGQASNSVALTITSQPVTITSISPSTALAGGAAFSLSITGTGFLQGATVSWNGTSLNTSFISATQLSAAVTADLIAQPGKASVTASNTNGAASNAVTFTITTPAPTLTSISPATVTQGGPAFTLTVNGTGFVTGAAVQLGGTALTTTFVSATQLTAAVPDTLIQKPGLQPVTATNPGSASSNPLPLTVNPPVPTITSISPTTVTAGGPNLTLTVNGTNFLAGAMVLFNGTPLNTTGVSPTQVTAQVPAAMIAQPGTAQITVTNMNGAPSIATTLTITPAAPTLTSISPVSAKVGDPTFTLSLVGTGFVQASVVQWDGAPLSTTFVSATQLMATIAAGRLILPATAQVTVVNAVPGGPPLVSNALTFTINPVLPTITSIAPNSAIAGDPAFSLTVNGTGLINLTTIQFGTTALTTHFVSATQVTADVPATLVATAGTVAVTAVNPGNNVSAAVNFTVNPVVAAVLSSLSKTSATAGDAPFTLTVTGTGFRSNAVVNFGATALATTFVSATQITAAVTAAALAVPGTFQVTVLQSGTTSNGLPFVISLPGPPALRLVSPGTVAPGTQTTIDFGLNSPYPAALTATVTLTFVSNATVPVDDPMIQLSTGGRILTFTIPANTTAFPALQIQTGTVAGTITIAVTLSAGGVNVTPTSGNTATILVPKTAPVMISGKVKLIKQAGYLEVDITGFSTTRDMTSATFHLNAVPGGSFIASDFTIPLSALFTTWYTSATSTAFGSQFSYAQPFTVIGDFNQVQSVTVTLTNSAGASVPMTTN